MSTSANDPADPTFDDVPPLPSLPPPPPLADQLPTPTSTHTPPSVLAPTAASDRGPETGSSHPSDQPADHPADATTGSRARNQAVVHARRGDLTTRWRIVLGAAWMAAFFAYAAVWQASVEIGIGTWWIGPRAQPTNVAVKVLPFVLCIAMAMCAVYNVPRLLHLSTLGVGLAAILALPDFSRSTGLAVTELLIAVLLGIVTAAAFTGRYRLAPTGTPSDTPSGPDSVRGSSDSADSTPPPRVNGP